MPTGHTEPPDPDALLALARKRAEPAAHTSAATPRATADMNAAAAEPIPAGRAAPSAADPFAEVPSREAPCDEPPAGPGDPARCADAPVCPTAGRAADPTRIVFTAEGPALVPGPVELVAADGTVLRSDRFLVALCQCKRSGTYPLCDTSHRRRPRGPRS